MLLSDERVDPSADYDYVINCASENGYDRLVTLLIGDMRVDPSSDYTYAIKLASKNGHHKVVQILLSDADFAIRDVITSRAKKGRRIVNNGMFVHKRPEKKRI